MDFIDFINKYCIKSVVCCFSGGKDSLVATHLTHSILRDLNLAPDIYTVFIDTTVMIPDVHNFVKDVAKKYDWNLKILRPKETFDDFVVRHGFPTMRRRWCCYHLKLEPVYRFIKTLKPMRVTITGLRRMESSRRKYLNQIGFIKNPGHYSYAPIIDWSDQDVKRYIKDHNLPMPPWYRKGLKETCLCGAFMHTQELLILKAKYPKLFNRFIELEKKMRKKGSAFLFDRKKVYAKELAKQKILDEYM